MAPLVNPARPPIAPAAAAKPGFGPPPNTAESSQLRIFAFYFGLAVVFIRLSVLHEVLAFLIGTSFYMLYIITPPALAGTLFTGGVRRSLTVAASRYWLAFFGWMVLAAVFSSWKGGSIVRVKEYGLYNLMLVFILAGLVTNWREIRLVFFAVAAAGLVNLMEAKLFQDTTNGRVSLWENGTISNSNDLASQLLLVLPFILWICMDSKRSVFIRVPLLGAIGYGLWVVVGTASRGALLGIMAGFLFIMWRSTMRQRVVTILVVVVFGVIILAALPHQTTNRLSSLFGEKNVEADESATTRSHLFRQSLLYTVQHPLFGVGPDQFVNYQGDEHEVRLWHGTHCAWTQVSSECGIPALVFFALGLGSALWAVARTYRTAIARGNSGIANACFCYLLAMVGYLISISFLSNAYTPALPITVGLGIAIAAAGAKEMAKASPAPLIPAAVRA